MFFFVTATTMTTINGRKLHTKHTMIYERCNGNSDSYFLNKIVYFNATTWHICRFFCLIKCCYCSNNSLSAMAINIVPQTGLLLLKIRFPLHYISLWSLVVIRNAKYLLQWIYWRYLDRSIVSSLLCNFCFCVVWLLLFKTVISLRILGPAGRSAAKSKALLLFYRTLTST
jgi:hypothetical protein